MQATTQNFVPTSDVQPPSEIAAADLTEIERALDSEQPAEAIKAAAYRKPSLAAIVELVQNSQGRASINAAGTRSPSLTSAQEVELDKLASARAVNVMLATADFWAATRVAGQTYVPGIGVGPLTLALVTEAAGQVSSRSHVVPAITERELHAAVGGVANGLDDDVFKLRLAAASQAPQYMFALALGLGLGPVRGRDLQKYPFTCMLFDVVPAVVTVAVHRLKHLARVPRPSELETDLKTTIDNPLFTAYPGGHAAIAHAMAKVLSVVTGASDAELTTLANRIAKDRELAAIHTDIDTAGGQGVGMAMAQWMLDAANEPETFGPWSGVYAGAVKEWK